MSRPRLVLVLVLLTWTWYEPVAPVAYQVILEPGIGQFRDFEPP